MSDIYAKVNGINICYEVKGNGEPVLLVHGFGAKKEAWICQFGPLSEYFKVIRFDNRGAGKSDRPNQSYTMNMFADDIRGLMDFINIKKGFVVGWSLGGMIVQTFALKYPNRINKMVLINTLPNWPSGDVTGLEMYINSKIASFQAYKKDPIKAFFDEANTSYTRNFKKEMEKDQSKKFHGLVSVDDLIREKTENPPEPQDIRNQANALKEFNVLEKLREIKINTLVIAAGQDRQTPKAINVKIHEKIPNSKLIIIENSGHRSPIESAPDINRAIIEFLNS